MELRKRKGLSEALIFELQEAKAVREILLDELYEVEDLIETFEKPESIQRVFSHETLKEIFLKRLDAVKAGEFRSKFRSPKVVKWDLIVEDVERLAEEGNSFQTILRFVRSSFPEATEKAVIKKLWDLHFHKVRNADYFERDLELLGA